MPGRHARCSDSQVLGYGRDGCSVLGFDVDEVGRRAATPASAAGHASALPILERRPDVGEPCVKVSSVDGTGRDGGRTGAFGVLHVQTFNVGGLYWFLHTWDTAHRPPKGLRFWHT